MNAKRAASLRILLNALSLDLAAANSAAEVRCIKQAIRSAELEMHAVSQ